MIRKSTPVLLAVLVLALSATAQIGLTPEQETKVEKAFATANDLYEKGKPREALKFYQEALVILPKDPAILFNAGIAAFEAEEYEMAANAWKRLKVVDPNDWRGRAKLIQVFHSLKQPDAIKSERAELFELRKSGKIKELADEDFYCREQFRTGDYKVVVFEHFELKGSRSLRYVFMIEKLDKSEQFKISLGSYDLTNSFWRSTTKPTPKEGERLFHLDGYFANGGHATYGMYPKEPTYEQTREIVVNILSKKSKPISSSSPVN